MHYSGYMKLSPVAVELWKTLVQRGYSTLLPGFLCRLIERVSWQKSGADIPGRMPSVAEQRFFNLPVWDSVSPMFQRMGEIAAYKNLWADRLYLVLDFFDIGRAGNFHWGDIDSLGQQLAILPDDYQTNPEYLGYLSDFDQSLREYLYHCPDFGLTEELRLQYPEVLSSATVEQLHRHWDALYSRYYYMTGVISPLEEDAEDLEMFAEPEMQMSGGYCDLEMRGEGNWSALLASELAYQDETMELDYFDIKYLESQLMFLKKDEGADRVIRRRLVLNVDAEPFAVNLRALARCMAWVQLLISVAARLYEKDRVQLIVLLHTGDKNLTKNILQLFMLRIQRQNLDAVAEIRFSMPPEDDGLNWQSIYLSNCASDQPAEGSCRILPDLEEQLGLLLKTDSIHERRLLRAVRNQIEFLKGRSHAKVSA